MEKMGEAAQELTTRLMTEALMFMHNISDPKVKDNAIFTKYIDDFGNNWGDCIIFTKDEKSILMTEDILSTQNENKGFIYTNGVLRVIILDSERIILQKLDSTKIGPNGILSEGVTIQ